MINYTTLKSELQADPKTLGYAALLSAGNDTGLANLLNATSGGGTGNVFRSDISIHDIVACIDPTDFSALVALQVQKLMLLFTGTTTLDLTVANNRQNLAGILTTASQTTKTAIAALAQRTGSRAEVLFGLGTVVTTQDIATARAS